MPMIGFPMAKINLGLSIRGKRPDGYHDLETFFYPIPFHDALEMVPADRDQFQIHGVEVPGPKEENLVWKALQRIREERIGEIPPLEIHLLKNIPSGAGLAGGSSDASMMLLLLNQSFSLGLSGDRLREIAAELGSDCPFFIDPRPSLARGRGEILQEYSLDLSPYDLILLNPPYSVSTREAFAGIRAQTRTPPLPEILGLPPREWKGVLINDFEAPLTARYPEIQQWKQTFYDQGAVYVSLSGTGSTIYALMPRNTPVSLSVRGKLWPLTRLPLDGRKSSP